MKKYFITTTLLLISAIAIGQDINTDGIANAKTQFIMKLKIGYSVLNISELHKVNGHASQLDLLLSSKLNQKFRLEYGLGASEFRGNHIIFDEYTDINNRYIRIPVNLIYSKEFSNNASLTSGLGFYASYLHKSKIFADSEMKNLGITPGVSVQLGMRFPITPEIETSLQFEYQYDLNGIKKEIYTSKILYSNLLSIGVVYKFKN